MKHIIIIILGIIFSGITACKSNEDNTKNEIINYQCPMHCEADKTYNEPGTCPICGMNLLPLKGLSISTETYDEISDLSLYNLPSTWTTQDGKDIELVELKGKVLVMVMIYTTCKAACPRLVADMRNIEEQLPESIREKIKMIFVSIDPNTDTPERLKEFAKENYMDEEPWLFLRSSEENTREFAAVLAVNYKKISPIDFSHSNIISVFNEQGELVHQQEGLGVNNKETIETIIQLTE